MECEGCSWRHNRNGDLWPWGLSAGHVWLRDANVLCGAGLRKARHKPSGPLAIRLAPHSLTLQADAAMDQHWSTHCDPNNSEQRNGRHRPDREGAGSSQGARPVHGHVLLCCAVVVAHQRSPLHPSSLHSRCHLHNPSYYCSALLLSLPYLPSAAAAQAARTWCFSAGCCSATRRAPARCSWAPV